MHKQAASQETPSLRWTKVQVGGSVCLHNHSKAHGSGFQPTVAAL